MATEQVTPNIGADGGGVGAQPTTDNAQQQGGVQPQGGQQQGQQQGGADNIRQLREAYEGVKRDFEPWQKLNAKPEQVGEWRGVHEKVYNEVANIGRRLGYPDDEIAEALRTDPVKTLDFLRQQAAQGQQQDDNEPDLQDLVAQHVEQAIGPIQQRENVRMTNEANSLFERTVHGLAVDAFKQEGLDAADIPQDEMFMLTSAVSEILKYDEQALRDLKYEGKTGAVQKAFAEARSYLDKYYLARSGRERSKLAPANGGRPAVQSNGQQRKPSLDEMIENPALINKKYV